MFCGLWCFIMFWAGQSFETWQRVGEHSNTLGPDLRFYEASTGLFATDRGQKNRWCLSHHPALGAPNGMPSVATTQTAASRSTQ
jgi:hypothetical protein